MSYAKKLTKEDLIHAGISIDNNLNVYQNGRLLKLYKTNETRTCTKYRMYNVKTRPYLYFNIYDIDDQGQRIKKQIKNKPAGYWVYKMRAITLQRAVYAWFYGEVPAGMTVDHIDNKHENIYDYRPENLQLLSPKDNVYKNSTRNTNRQVKCGMHKPLEHFENKLKQSEDRLSKCTDSIDRHKLINECALFRAKIRYWKAHSEEYYNWIEMKNNG